jgi:hypothetical protein
MMDALVAVAILGLVGSGALALATNLLAGQERQLDRSVALLTSELLARQYAEFGPDPATTGPRVEDELFIYEFAAVGETVEGSRLRPMVVIARGRGQSGAEELRLDFLAATGPS